jgi:putative transposase
VRGVRDFPEDGHKIYQRYRQIGVQGLTDRSRRPHRHANQLPMVVEKTIVKIKREYPSWGAPKIRERLRQRWPEVHCPAISTVHAVLDRHGLVTGGRGDHAGASRARRSPGQPPRIACGAPTTKASSCSATGGTAIR